MSDINKEIEEMAESMEKSANPHAELFDTIKKLGPEGIKAKLLAKSEDGTPLLDEQDRIVLKDALTEMKKAVEMDDSYQAKYHMGNVYRDTVIQEDKVDDDADEKLVKPEAAEHNHQGDVTPEAREGQVIKGKQAIDIADDAEETADEAVGKVKKTKKEDHKKQGEDKGMKKSNEDLLDEIKKSDDMMYKMVSKMCKKCNYDKKMVMDKCMAKGMDKDKVSGMIDRAMKDHNKTMHDGGMKKTYGTMEKGKDMGGAKPNPEEGQVKDDLESLQKEPTRGDKSRPEDMKVEEENKDAQDKVDDVNQGKMKKSIEWDGPNAILEHGKGGQNHNFSVNQYYDNALAKAEEQNKSADENLEKSEKSDEPKKLDINDLIEKSMDQSRQENITEQLLTVRDEYVNPKFSKSFEDGDLYESLGMTEEEAKKVLGE